MPSYFTYDQQMSLGIFYRIRKIYWISNDLHITVLTKDPHERVSAWLLSTQIPWLCLPPSTPLTYQLLALIFPMHIKVLFPSVLRCTWRGWRNLMPPLISKHCCPPTRHFLNWSHLKGMFEVAVLRAYLIDLVSFLSGKELLWAQMNSWSTPSGGWCPTLRFLLCQKEFIDIQIPLQSPPQTQCYSQGSRVFPPCSTS